MIWMYVTKYRDVEGTHCPDGVLQPSCFSAVLDLHCQHLSQCDGFAWSYIHLLYSMESMSIDMHIWPSLL